MSGTAYGQDGREIRTSKQFRQACSEPSFMHSCTVAPYSAERPTERLSARPIGTLKPGLYYLRFGKGDFAQLRVADGHQYQVN